MPEFSSMLAYLSIQYKRALFLLPPDLVQVSPSQPHSWKYITVVTDFASAKTSVAAVRDDAELLALYFVYLGICRFLLSCAYDTLLTYTAYHITGNIRHASSEPHLARISPSLISALVVLTQPRLLPPAA
ncbi:hypothetical protein BJY01DRAFT_120398 [Aspergillus pseudoustus]|uniref:Uncharacterized protein n=1 Tax=Aspergillus pseudoustus TaxID=1810923 RepID=A0ABR4KFY5_9EURO